MTKLALLLVLLALASGHLHAQEYTSDETVWPNKVSHTNSDAWLRLHHDEIKVMRPRVLVLNFVNGITEGDTRGRVERFNRIVKEASRDHGYKNQNAPAFMDYQIFKVVNLTDPEELPEDSRFEGNSSKYPRIPDAKDGQVNLKFETLFSEAFSENYQVHDPDNPGKLLSLSTMIDRGMIHEVWILAQAGRFGHPPACAEIKPVYGVNGRPRSGKTIQAGNEVVDDLSFSGHSIRFLHIDAGAQAGCAFEHYCLGFQSMALSKSIPALTKYFTEFAGLNLKARYKLPFDFFEGREGGSEMKFPDANRLVYRYQNENFVVPNYVAAGGTVQFHPAARREFDLDGQAIALSSIEHYRQHDGDAGKDKAEPWSTRRFANYRQLAQGCQGPWLVYWRQNMPGLDNKLKDDDGLSMKNWWVYLFY